MDRELVCGPVQGHNSRETHNTCQSLTRWSDIIRDDSVRFAVAPLHCGSEASFVSVSALQVNLMALWNATSEAGIEFAAWFQV